MLNTKQLTYCSRTNLLFCETDYMYIFITVVNFNSIDKISQVYDDVKNRKTEKNYSIKHKASEGISLVQQSKGYFKCIFTK